RVDGACLLGPHPTTAEILQWAAHKWGLSPLVAYAETTNDGDWDQTKVSTMDYGCSVGVAQVSDCNPPQRPHHSIRGLATGEPGHPLPSENTCFNADLWAAFLYKHYTSGCGIGDLPVAIQQWDNRRACTPGRFAQRNCASLATHNWNIRFFNGDPVPY